MPSLSVTVFRKLGHHHAPVLLLGKLLGRPAPGGRDHASHSEMFPQVPVVPLAVVSCICQQFVKRLQPECFPDSALKLPVVGQRPAVHHGRKVEITLGVADHGELRITALLEPATLAVVRTCASRLVTGRVDGAGLSPFFDQAAFPRLLDCSCEEFDKAPFFSRRFSA